MDEVFGIGDLIEDEIKKEKNAAYTAANLKGLKVEHDLDGFSEGKQVILTLKDKGVLDEEEDALVNVNMIDDEKYKKNVANKKLKPFHYNGIDPGEMDFDESKTVLSKYDEEIDGVKKTSFKLGEEDLAARKEAIKQRLQQKSKMKLESLSLPEPKIASEYFTPTEMIRIKKPKKKKKIRSKMLKADDLLQATGAEDSFSHLGRRQSGLESSANGTKVEVKQEPKEDDAMDIDEDDLPLPHQEEVVKIEVDDDTELQLALKKARRLKQMPSDKLHNKLPKVEEVLEQIKEEPEESDPSGTAIVLNSTAEFCRTLGDIPTYGLAGNRDEDPGILLDFEAERDQIKNWMRNR
uniref:U4/U6.U5 tri-snRNP-associated protein 1 n=1 Tax=Rhodnius prolixus TaxID=13249 RepID=T1I2N6_RHOPR